MSTIVTRNGKGSPLTFDEADANFTNLNNDKYQANDSPTFNVVTATQYVGGEFTDALAGIVPASGGGTTTFLRADATWATVTSGAPTDATYVTLSTDTGLSNERVLTAGEYITITDAGAGDTVTVEANASKILSTFIPVLIWPLQ